MGIQGFERRLESLVEGTFARVFKSGLNPVELGRKMVREMDDNRTVNVNGRVIVPNLYQFSLSRDDYAQLAEISGSLSRDLGDAAREHARDMGYGFVGPINVSMTTDEGLRPGLFSVAARFKESESVLVGSLLLPTGDRVPLGNYVITIGRASDCTIVLGDPKVSRRHAEIRPTNQGFLVVDLNSTNGSFVNRQPISQQLLSDGDEVGFGHTYFYYEAY